MRYDHPLDDVNVHEVIQKRVKEGTPFYGKRPLCLTCRHSSVVRGETLNQTIISCPFGAFEGRVPFCVTECTDYLQINALSLSEMSNVAHVLTLDRKGEWGFLSPKEYGDSKEKL